MTKVDHRNQNILTVNAGSSSIKFALYYCEEGDDLVEQLHGEIKGISQGTISGKVTDLKTHNDEELELHGNTMASAIQGLVLYFQQNGIDDIHAIGHRIVHGGARYNQAQLVTNQLFANLNDLSAIDPEHMPAALALLQQLATQWPASLHVACFDTAFFHDLPRQARMVALPRKVEAYGVRRYGFHGLSYTFVQEKFEQLAGEKAVHGKVIYAHLGSGASLCATLDKKPMDTTMGFSPASGVVMSTRSGDLDPTIGAYLNQVAELSDKSYAHMVNHQSGLLGISETTGDMYTLLQQESTDPRSSDAVEQFCYQVRKAIGSLSAAIGGLNSLVFTGGIGEQSSILRKRICSGLDYLGIQLDDARNENSDSLISPEGSVVGVHVIPTDESLVIARQTREVIKDMEGEA